MTIFIDYSDARVKARRAVLFDERGAAEVCTIMAVLPALRAAIPMHQSLYAVVFSLLAIPAFAQAVLPVPDNVRAEGVPPIPLELVDVVSRYGEFRSATLLDWHPRERRMLISTTFGNVPQIHEVKGPGFARIQQTFYRDGVTGGAWFEPGGRYFVFRKDTARGGEAMQLFRFEMATGTAVLLTDGTSRNGDPVWANTRELIAYDSTRRDGKNRDLYVMNPSTPGSNRMLAKLEGNWWPLDWSPDDKQLLVLESVSSSSETYLWSFDAETGQGTALTDRAGGHVFWSEARFGADGRSVYALGDRGEEIARLWKLDLASRTWTAISGEGDAIEAFAEAPDGRRIALVVDRDGASHLVVLDAHTRKPQPTPSFPPGVISTLAWHPRTGELAVVFAGARTFNDVYSLRPGADSAERWTVSEAGGANPDSLPEAETIRWKSADGLMIPGVLYRPPPRFAGPRPVIINIHGGPELRERPRALGRSNHFRNDLGIALIYPNVRGSIGFGRTFESLDDGPKRADAVKDIGALLDWIATQPYLDKDRVMLTGASYGGYLTLMAAAQYGDRIRCAFEGFGMSDLVSFLESTDVSRRADRNVEYGDPSDPATREYLTNLSPLTHASKLKIPLFIVQGARDTRVPLAQSEAMVAAIRGNGSPLWYVVYTDAGHMQFTTATNNFNTYAWVMFVRQFLLN
ncbi:MAG TPA: prolyl oligopeptidase family serine peptidase [Vicinamibacterales bacterium]|nr:prolyl oligopeptidase family serine peptidase [Vicinamibacterales bacterium]